MQRSWLQTFVSLIKQDDNSEHTRVDDSLLREGLEWCRLVALSVDELVVDDLNRRVLIWQERDLVGNSLRIVEGWDLLSNTGEVEYEILCV